MLKMEEEDYFVDTEEAWNEEVEEEWDEENLWDDNEGDLWEREIKNALNDGLDEV